MNKRETIFLLIAAMLLACNNAAPSDKKAEPESDSGAWGKSQSDYLPPFSCPNFLTGNSILPLSVQSPDSTTDCLPCN
ncbi:MAG: hypothetical protein R3B47_10165 [Bacteroidia bacterium]